jgi:glycosyltransferase involved in cell wall biosynthesis
MTVLSQQSLSISIVMPLYNKETDVRRAVESVLNQSVSNFELIVVNDGSTDRGPDVVRSISDARIRVFDQENAGVSAARNRGINESKSDLIAFLDADDEWNPEFLETILHLREKYPSCGVFATNYIFREVNGKHHLPIIRGLPPHPWEGVIEDYFGVAVRSDPPLWTSAIAVTKKAILAAGLFPVGVTNGEDLLTWARLAVEFDIAYSTMSGSVFYLRAPLYGSPVRLYDKHDYVGPSLELLLQKVESTQKDMVREYIALWYRMRAAIYLEIGERQEALYEIKKMRKFSKRRFIVYIYHAVAIMPHLVLEIAVKGFSLMKTFRRRLVKRSAKVL